MQTIPEEYASQIPSIAFSVPDLDGNVKLELTNPENNQSVACIQSEVTNGHSFIMPAISYVAAGIAAAALLLTGLSALSGAGAPASPTFGETMGWFQGMAMNGMMSVQYPKVYQSFAGNFGFSTGLIPWGSMQQTIDGFRQKTGGNLTDDSYSYLSNNATLVYNDGSTNATISKRALDVFSLWARDGTSVTVNGTTGNVGGNAGNETTSSNDGKQNHFVTGIQAYVEQLTIPQANTFMTVLLVWAIVVAVIIVFILLLKLILELWAMFGNIPKSMESWRKRYWWRLSKALTNLTLMLYGVWTLYCIYQFTNGDSWAAKTLAAITWGLFTAALAFFTWRIFSKAHQYRKMEGDASKLYEDKETWVKYNNFYENYKKGYWWLFLPIIIYMFARGGVIAGANGHGLFQTGGQLIVESVMLAFLLWTRPFERRSGNWMNITIQAVRVISVVCILIFVEELGISQTTKTITGVILIVVQCVLTGILAIMIAINSIVNCVKENPHRRKRKQAEKLNRDLDDLTPLDARNSLLMEPMAQKNADGSLYKAPVVPPVPFGDNKGRYDAVPPRPHSPAVSSTRSFSRPSRFGREEDGDFLVSSAASMGRRDDRSVSRSPPRDREPKLPDVGFGRAY